MTHKEMMAHCVEDAMREVAKAEKCYGPSPASTHESYGDLAEELRELLDAIQANDVVSIQREAIQIAAVALRLAAACLDAHRENGDTDFARRSFPWARKSS